MHHSSYSTTPNRRQASLGFTPLCLAFLVSLQFFGASAAIQAQDKVLRSSYRPSYSSYPASKLGREASQRVNSSLLRVFRQATGNSWKSAVRITVEGDQIALGTVVDPDGWIITKASQLPATGDVGVRLWDYRELPAEVVRTSEDLDIALLRVSAKNLPTSSWSYQIPVRGNWLATVDAKQTPSAIGVVSTGVQRINRSDSVLGVELTSSADGARVTRVLRGTGAYDAGLRVDDSIFEVNGIEVFDLSTFRRGISGLRGGDVVNLKVQRGNKKYAVDALLMDLTEELLDETEMEVNGFVSARATGFDRVFLHDTVLMPNQCGGPLVNLNGDVVGINIARAGRVTSYAIPADILKPVVDTLIEEAKLVSRNAEASKSLTDQIR